MNIYTGKTMESAVDKCRELIAKRIRERRTDLGLTQEQLAERSDLSANYIARLELGWKTPSLSTIVRLAEALDVNASDLLATGEEERWLDRAHEVAYLLNDLDEFEVDFIVSQLRSTVQLIKRERETRRKPSA